VTDAWVLAPHRMDTDDETGITESADPLWLVPSTLSGFGLATGWLTHLRISRNQREEIADARLTEVDDVALGGLLERTTRVHIPIACCPGGGATGPARVFRHEREFDANEAPPIPEDWLRTSYPASDPVCARDDWSGGAWSGGSSSFDAGPSSSGSGSGSGSSYGSSSGSSYGGGCGASAPAPDAGSASSTSSSSSSSSRPLRGCAVPARSGGPVFAWMPIALAVLWVFGRSRRR
jgi:hypothetical protein